MTTAFAAILAFPAVAAVLGLAAGACALVMTYRGSRMLTPQTLELGAARAVVLASLGMVVAFLGLLGYYLWVREGLVYFGIGLVVGFLAPAFVALFRFSGIAGTSGGGGR